MDPVSAIGVAAGIIAFIDFAWKLVSGANEHYEAATNSMADDAHIITVIGDLRSASSGLVVADVAKQDHSAHLSNLVTIGACCQDLAKDLLDALERLRAESSDNVWGKLKVHWKKMRKEKKFQMMLAKLRDYREQIILRLSMILR